MASRNSLRKMKSHFPSLVLVRITKIERQNNLSIETFTHHPLLSENSQPSDMFPGPPPDFLPSGPGPGPQLLPLHHHQQAGGVDLPLVRQQFLFPVGPCEYGGPFRALQEGDYNAVFLLDEPEKVPRHNIYEFVWFLKTGLTRMKRMMLGLEPFQADFNILTEGYQHYTPSIRTTQLGHGTERRPEIIDDPDTFVDFVGGKIRSLFTEGPDLQRTRYTP